MSNNRKTSKTTKAINDPNGLNGEGIKYRRPSVLSNDPEEKRLAECMLRYIDPTSDQFDPEFKAWLDAHCPALLDASGISPELRAVLFPV